MFRIVVGGVIKKDNKYLLIQEKKEQCYGKWSSPSGRLEEHESIFEGAIREIKEESGYDVELTGLLDMKNLVYDNVTILCINFETNVIGGDIFIKEDEVLDIKWFTYEEILNMKDELRRPDLLLPLLKISEENKCSPIDNIQIIKEVTNN